MSCYTLEQVKTALIKKGYQWFDQGDYNINIIGIRNSSTGAKVTNKFDDCITVSYKENGNWIHRCYEATTDPGTHWLRTLLNPKGTAILVPGQYRATYQIGKHQGRYEALVQRKPVKVYRDGDRDMEYDKDTKTIQEGLFGINIHRASQSTTSKLIDKWSAGCQVIASAFEYADFMKRIKKGSSVWGNSFTYTLIESKDID